MRMKDLRKIGGFHPFVLPHYMSDYEFTIRAYHKGMRLRTVSDLAIFMNPEQTGFRNFENSEFRIFLKQYFSKKSVSNPIYQMVFVVLACPALYMPMNILRILKAAVWHILKQLKIPIQNLYH